jgi:hypothetical protein
MQAFGIRPMPKLLAIIFIFIMIGIGTLAILGSSKLSKLHQNEIQHIITEKGGVLKNVKKVDKEQSPFSNDSNKDNVIYQVTYEKNGQSMVAWYRGVKTINNIHSQHPSAYGGGYGEKWLFPNE